MMIGSVSRVATRCEVFLQAILVRNAVPPINLIQMDKLLHLHHAR